MRQCVICLIHGINRFCGRNTRQFSKDLYVNWMREIDKTQPTILELWLVDDRRIVVSANIHKGGITIVLVGNSKILIV